MSGRSPSEQGKPRWTGISVALFVIGLLILIPSGLCAGLGLVFGLADPAMLGLLLIGAVPAAIGAVLVWAGLKARRRD